jgi:hypothetical protein
MAATHDAHFELNRVPKTAHAAAFEPARVSFCYAYYYACQAMLEGRSSGG